MAVSECNGVIRLDVGRHGVRGREGRAGGAEWAGRMRDLLRSAWRAQRLVRQARRTRRELAQMDDRMLSDIGIGRADAYEEARRASWDTGPRPR